MRIWICLEVVFIENGDSSLLQAKGSQAKGSNLDFIHQNMSWLKAFDITSKSEAPLIPLCELLFKAFSFFERGGGFSRVKVETY
ncbi:hypothetical protein [Pseudoalteromonas arctica]|uniref:hypothetical protein n=1 Tax=Pseudoalteromonas arctica TaxID=394751 RepID=UPI002494481F|nr:hypothetical protein [Pseudoalteromonas arctica]